MYSMLRDNIKKYLQSKYFIITFFIVWFLFFLTLSWFRDSRLDENIYFSDSNTISMLLRNGEWIGNSGVGLHGFISKLIVGCIFIFTGPSIFVATTFNIVVAVASGFIFFRILYKYFAFSKYQTLLGVTLLFSSYQFITYTPTFYRDILALFVLLLIVESILAKKNLWITGVFLLLLLDAKEHVFFTITPGVIMWVVLKEYLENRKDLLKMIKGVVFSGIQLFLPSIILLYLMFFTSVIPLNIYNANILGLIESGFEKLGENFYFEAATLNRDYANNKELIRLIPTLSVPESGSAIIINILTVLNIFLQYIGKILYPRTFSFLSVPFILLIPSLFWAFRSFIGAFKVREYRYLLLPITLLVYLLIYILHSSISRYILPISPLLFIYFLQFIFKNNSSKKDNIKILLITLLFVVAGLYFEYSYVLIKILITSTIIFLLFIHFVITNRRNIISTMTILFISLTYLGTALLASYLYGQLRGYLVYGYNREVADIVSLIPKDEKVWINDIYWDKLPFILRGDSLSEAQWRWELKEWVPKKKLLGTNNDLKTFNYYWKDIETMKQVVYRNGINKILYVKVLVNNPKERLLMQDRLDILLKSEWLELEQKVDMKNKEVYIFKVVD